MENNHSNYQNINAIIQQQIQYLCITTIQLATKIEEQNNSIKKQNLQGIHRQLIGYPQLQHEVEINERDVNQKEVRLVPKTKNEAKKAIAKVKERTYKNQRKSKCSSKNIPKIFGNHYSNHLSKILKNLLKIATRLEKQYREIPSLKIFLQKKIDKKQYSYTIKDFKEHFKDKIGSKIARNYFKHYLYLDLLGSRKNTDMDKYFPFIDKFIRGTYFPEKFNNLI